MLADEMRNDWMAAAKWVWDEMELKGFHDDGDADEETMMAVRSALAHTEIAEATQEIKRHWTDSPSDELKDKVAEELADFVIRVMDFSICHNVELNSNVECGTPAPIVGRYRLITCMGVLHYMEAVSIDTPKFRSDSIKVCEIICNYIGRDLWVAVEKKMAKNIARPMNYGTPSEVK